MVASGALAGLTWLDLEKNAIGDEGAGLLAGCPDLGSLEHLQIGGVGLTDVYLYDRKESKAVDVTKLNSPQSDVEPTLSHDGKLIAFVSDRPGGKGGRDVYLYDRDAGKLVDLPGLNSAAHEQSPALSLGGRFIVFVSERVKGEGERDVYLYDRKAEKLLPTPGLNSKAEDFDPCVVVLHGKE